MSSPMRRSWMLRCWLLLVATLLAGCGGGLPEPMVKIVTVVVSATPMPIPTARIVTEVQTVVVVVTATQPATTTPRPAATRRATRTRTPPPTTSPLPTTTPTPTFRPSATATQAPQPQPPTETPVPAPVPPTAIPTRTRPALVYGTPQLLNPVEGEVFNADGQPVLRWEAVGTLAPDEYYEVTIERVWQNAPYYAGSDWTKEAEYIVPKAIVLNTSDIDTYTWWVTVKRLTGNDTSGNKRGEAISPPSESRTFLWR